MIYDKKTKIKNSEDTRFQKDGNNIKLFKPSNLNETLVA